MKTIGVITTLIYIIFISWLIGDRFSQLNTMPLNEIGDFCAGAFGPITFFWLILGFIMQTQELKQSSAALKLQADELKNSVEQQKEMVRLSSSKFDRELEIEKLREKERVVAAQPIFDLVSANSFSNVGGVVKHGFKLMNSGSRVTDVSISVPSKYRVIQSQYNIWDYKVSNSLELAFSNTNQTEELVLTFSYIDGHRNKQTEEYNMTVECVGTNKMSFSKKGS